MHASAKQGLGIDELLDAILFLQAEVLELKAVKEGMARCCYRILP